MKYDLRWGLTTLGRPEATLAESMQDADRFNIEFIEPRAINGSVELQETLKDPETFQLLCELTAAGRVRVLGTSFRLAADDPEGRKNLAEIAAFADRAGVPYLRIFGGCLMTDEVADGVVARAKANLEWFDSLNCKCKLALETHDGFSSAERCRKLFEAMGRRIAIVWDAHHTWRIGKEPLEFSYNILKDDIVDVHFKDSLPNTGPGPHSSIATNLGEGDVPLDELFTLLVNEKVQYPISLEYEKKWCPYLPELDEALAAWQKLFM
ncbi:MAG: sugar phosphate isomerase/epimerase [Lentisphaeria bacterium]|nr:sugar phosphate isomerase/epimerase [Lentisphaeria bacterium]